MKRRAAIIFSILMGLGIAFSQNGVWSGDLDVQGVKLPVIFNLDDDKPTLSSPAQRVKDIPVTLSRPLPDSIIINIPLIGATFQGRYEKEEIIGKFSQRGYTFPLILTKGEKIVIRPQTPKPPYPYSQEKVSFVNGDAVLKGTLTLPEGATPQTPVLIMITGSGLQNRDEEIFEHKPFAVIADALAKNGIGSLRYDDRGFGESTGDAVNCTIEDLRLDALAGINRLRQRYEKVGVLGHSEGGTISLMLGTDDKVDFIISLAGMAISGKETLLDQNRYILSQAGYPSKTVDEYCSLLSAAFEGDGSVEDRVKSTTLPTELKQNLLIGLRQLNTPYMQYFLASDMSNKLGGIHCPVLALNGKKDTQVFYEKNLDALNKGLPANHLNKIVALDNLNHLLQHCATGSVNEYASIEETISPEVLDTICDWIKSIM